MFRPRVKVPRPSADALLALAGLLLALIAARAVLLAPTGVNTWADILFLISVLLFLLGIVRFLVRALDIEDELDDFPAAAQSAHRETDAAGK